MINLIPNKEKKNKVKDFYLRLFILFIIIISCSFFLASILLIPSYYASYLKENLINSKLNTLKTMPIQDLDKTNSLEIKDLDNQLSLIGQIQQNTYIVSEKVINEVIFKKMPDIKIEGISYEDNKEFGVKSINISGIAKSRERLLLFRKALEEDKFFKKVDLPISNFVKGSDIEFNLNLTPS